jgi:oxygen-independent coproporphyrinogen-3 oxidase
MRRVATGTQIVERRQLERRDLPFEFMMNALRLTEGFPVLMFAERTGLPIVAAERALAQAEVRGLLERDHERIRPTALGRRYLNDLLGLFLPEEGREKRDDVAARD